MNIVGTVDGVELKNQERKIKVVIGGTSDVRETDDCGTPGIDASPIRGMKAIYADTQVEGEEVIIGYIIDNQEVAPGEIKIFSQDDNGQMKFYAHLRKDGTCHFGGNQDNMVRYSALESAFNQLKSDFNDLVSKFNSHTHVLTLSSGTGTAAPTAAPGTPSASDITGAKIEQIKTL